MSDKPISKLYEMSVRGRDYEELYELEMFGEPVKAVVSPLPDIRFIPMASALQEHLGLDSQDEATEAAIEEFEKAKEEAGDTESMELSKMDDEVVGMLQTAAIYGIKGSYAIDERGDEIYVEHDYDRNYDMITGMVGGYSVELGAKVLEVSGDVRDATKFRGSRGGQRGFSAVE